MAGLCDYKIASRTDYDDGHSVLKVRFYEGDITTENELLLDGTIGPVTRYRRTGKLGEETIDFNPLTQPDTSRMPGRQQEVRIKTHLNAMLLRFGPRAPIAEQTNA